MKLKEVNKTGFFISIDDKERKHIYEVFKNGDEKWLKEEPEATFLVDEWIYSYTDVNDRKIYEVWGVLVVLNHDNDICELDVEEITDTKYVKIADVTLMEDKPTYKELYLELKNIMKVKDIIEIIEKHKEFKDQITFYRNKLKNLNYLDENGEFTEFGKLRYDESSDMCKHFMEMDKNAIRLFKPKLDSVIQAYNEWLESDVINR